MSQYWREASKNTPVPHTKSILRVASMPALVLGIWFREFWTTPVVHVVDVDLVLAGGPAVAAVLAFEDVGPGLGGLQQLPGVRVFQGHEVRNGVQHVDRVSGRVQGVRDVLHRRAACGKRADVALAHALPAHVVARRADAAMHEGHGVEHLDELFSGGNLGGGLTREEVHLVDAGDLLGQRDDAVGGNGAQGLGPCRVLRLAVIGSQDVVLEVLLRVDAFGHVGLVEAHAVLVQILLVVGAVLDPLMAYGQGQRRVAAGEDGHPSRRPVAGRSGSATGR